MRLSEAVFLSLQLIACHATALAAEPPVWAVDPATPGPDAPPMGASLFDLITMQANGVRDVPFPYEKLLNRIEAAAGCSAGAPCVLSVLLPLGRSLQRVAASPDFFASPRIVSAVVGEGRGARLLRDRLYIGYQERSALIEVISYNEAAGRFEFQLVKNYREGTQPDVFHARRDVCLACHQNHGPIFSRQVWDETNANPVIAARLEEHHTTFQSIAARGSTDISNAVDDATDRANRISLTNVLWEDGCGVKEAGARCRTGALTAALQFALTGHRAYDADPSFTSEVAATLLRSSQRLWPGGLAIPNPDVPNRNPLAANESGLAQSHVPAVFEALAPRAPLEILPADGAQLADVLVKGLSESFGARDVEELSRALAARAYKSRQLRAYEGRCAVQRRSSRIRFHCTHSLSDSSFELRGWIDQSSGVIDALRVDDGSVVRHLEATSIRSKANAVAFAPRMRGTAARLPDGNAVEMISLRWPAGRSREQAEATASVSIMDDFAPARLAIARILSSRPESTRPLALDRVLAELRSGDSIGRREDSVHVQASIESAPESADAQEFTAPFRSHCGACHHSAESSPPNFLSGDATRVQRALKSCAPRIYVRLAMNELPPAQRDKTPMPPEAPSVHGLRRTAAPLRGDLRALRGQIERRLREEYGRVPTVSELLANGYEKLRPCLSVAEVAHPLPGPSEDPLTPALSQR
ncbi:MAG: hypothetical protein ACREV5_17010, partial [Steroidobacter sp.]